MQYFVPNCFVFQRKTLCRRSERVSCAPFSCRGTARGRPLFSSRGTGGFHQGTIRCGSGCFSCETGKLLPRESPPRLRNRFPTRLQKSWEGEGWGLGRGEGTFLKKGSLSPPQCIHKSPRQHDVAGGLIQLGCEGCAKAWLSTCRPCRPYHPYRAWRACPSWVRAFRQWRIRWSGAGKPRKRRSAELYGPPSWGR